MDLIKNNLDPKEYADKIQKRQKESQKIDFVDAPQLPPGFRGKICPLMSNVNSYQKCGRFCKWYRPDKGNFECLIMGELNWISLNLAGKQKYNR